jgi:hypothetical protein
VHPIHPYRKAHPHSKLLTIESVIYLGFVVFLFMLLGYVTNANPGAVVLAFFPALAFGIILIILVETDHFFPTYNWFVMVGLLVIAAIMYFILPAASGLDVGTVLVMNGLLMAVALTILHSSFAHEQPVHEHTVIHQEQKEHVVHHVHHHEAPKEIDEVIHSIEDKVKALNFVIGRVYSVYHGGTDQLRNKLRIDKTWYDDFNQIDRTDIDKRKHEAIVLLQKIKARLDLLQRTEKDVLGNELAQLKNIQHDPAGNDKIITVLVKNDKDPVQRYYDGAMSFCEDALKILRA